jgi:hypothetical protein
LSQSAQAGHWGSTFANAWVIYAMTGFDQQGSISRSVKAVVEFGGEEYPVSLDRQNRKALIRLNNHPGPMKFRFLGDKEGNLAYLTLRAALRPAGHQNSAVKQGLEVHREYVRLNAEGAPEKDVPMRVGDLVKVKLKLNVQSDDTHYLAVEDGLPASLEPVFTRLKSQKTNVETGYSWRIDHHELRKDRAVFYLNHPRKGKYVFEYIARVRAEGEVTVPPVKAEAMYNPDIIGISVRQKLFTHSLHE